MTDKTYLAAQLRRLSPCNHHYTYQIRSDDGSHTNWMNLTRAELNNVSKVLLEDQKRGSTTLAMDGRVHPTLSWNELSDMGLLERINREVFNPLGLAVFRDVDSGLSGGAVVGEFAWTEPQPTPSSTWRASGEEDPHVGKYDGERATLCLGDYTDDQLANAVFLHGNSTPPLHDVIAGKARMPIVYLTAAKERIRWLSRKLEGALARLAVWERAEPWGEHDIIPLGEGSITGEAYRRGLASAANGLQAEEHPDTRAMKAIAQVLSGEEWDSDTVDEVARIIRNHGYEILDSDEGDDHDA